MPPGIDNLRLAVGIAFMQRSKGTKSRETIYGASVRAAAERAAEAQAS
jgi:hypothetical protein